jgi:ribA/ribD-fused uncharacterized protein
MTKIDTFTTDKTRFLSNFYPYKNRNGDQYPHKVSVCYGGYAFACVENAYQAAKSQNKEDMQQFVSATPFWAKDFVDSGCLCVRQDWEKVKYTIMFDLVKQKFTNNQSLRKMLLDTGNVELIEGNSWGDTYWGICNGVGENNLGKILMLIRKNFQPNI